MRKFLAVIIAVLLFAGVVPALAAVTAPDATAPAAAVRVQPELTAQLEAASDGPGSAERVAVIVHAATAARAAAAAQAHGLEVGLRFDRVGAVAAAGAPAAVAALTGSDDVNYVEADLPLVPLMETSHIATRGDQALAGFTGSRTVEQPDQPGAETTTCAPTPKKNGKPSKEVTCETTVGEPVPQPPLVVPADSTPVDGTGVTIAIIDSGIDGTHPMFQQDGKSRVVRNLRLVCTVDPGTPNCTGPDRNANDDVFVDVTDAGAANDTDTMALGGHGTHVAGTAAGGRVTTTDGRELHGAAPGSKLVGLSVGQAISRSGAAAGLNWVLEHHAEPCGPGVSVTDCPPIRVVNNSYGAGGADYNPNSLTTRLSDLIARAGVVMVWANGNGDTTGNGGTGADNRSNAPGQSTVPGVISVANYDDGGTGTRDGTLNSSSSRGHSTRPQTFPDLSAPGTDITSACKVTLVICRTLPGPDTDPNYGTISGTSMASPHVAGIAAQLIQAGHAVGVKLTPGMIEDTLKATAYKFSFGAPYQEDVATRGTGLTSFDKGYGLVDAKAAVASIQGIDLVDAPAPSPAEICSAGRIAKDPEGDGTDPSVDVAEAFMARGSETVTDSDGTTRTLPVMTTSIDVVNLEATFPTTYNGYAFYADFVVDGRPYYVSATRSQFSEGAFSLGRPKPATPNVRESLSTAGMRGSFDYVGDRIRVTLTQAALDEANAKLAAENTPTLPSLDGFVFPDLKVVSYLQRDLVRVSSLPAGDTAGSGCRFSMTDGSSPNPPAVPPPAADPDGSLAPGGRYDWTGDTGTDAILPFTGTNASGCDGKITNKACDREHVAVDIAGADRVLAVSVTADEVFDPYVYVYDPTGVLLGSGGGKVVVPAKSSGTYTFVVRAYASTDGPYAGSATLT